MGLPFRHDAALYGTDEEYLGVVVPFLREGLDAEQCLKHVDEQDQRRVVPSRSS